MNIPDFLSYLGTFVFAITGAMKARTHKMDLIGGLVLAFVTAYGGGTLRDLIIGVRPVNWVNDNVPLLFVLAATTLTFLLRDNLLLFRRFIFYTDFNDRFQAIGGKSRAKNKQSFSAFLFG